MLRSKAGASRKCGLEEEKLIKAIVSKYADRALCQLNLGVRIFGQTLLHIIESLPRNMDTWSHFRVRNGPENLIVLLLFSNITDDSLSVSFEAAIKRNTRTLSSVYESEEPPGIYNSSTYGFDGLLLPKPALILLFSESYETSSVGVHYNQSFGKSKLEAQTVYNVFLYG
ncbi:hypothetical protein CSKR_112928 [Clonorchis sinensis]|uniref:Uncharacterized protein n=1 Tax=Clonorchis sinensis TaxID=79923 RepID=A0A3R7JLL2_CLOSI|nr:hypothetical protein CSKR_112928 [Clonorchis sinensis]